MRVALPVAWLAGLVYSLSPDQVDDLRATLYGRDAVLTLHFAQEEQDHFALADRER